MYRRYYRYHDPMPTAMMRQRQTDVPVREEAPVQEIRQPAPERILPKPIPEKPIQNPLPFKLPFFDRQGGMQTDDLLLLGILFLVLFGEEREEIDLPLVLSLCYLLISK